VRLADGANASDIAYRWHWQLGRLLKQQGDIAGAILAYDAAIDELQVLRNDLATVNRDVQFSFRDSVEPVYRQSVELLLQSQITVNAQVSGRVSELENERILDKARQRVEALQLAELDDFFRESCLDTTTVLLDKVVDQDNPTTAILYPIILPDQLEVIAKVPGQPLHHYAINQSQVDVERVLTQLRQSITEPDTIAEVKALSQQLYGWLIQPLASELERSEIKTLVFVLDGALRSVPMAALYDGKQYLIEKYAVALSPGLQLLSPEPIAQEKLQVLAAGLIQPPSNFQNFPPLPEIQSEFNAISTAGVPITTLLDQDFTSATLENQVNQATFNILHLATHGQFSSRAEDTFILAADGPINVTQFDTFLRRRDQTQSSTIELLVLSACQTAAGDNRATLGLAGAAVRAGAKSTLASLWNIGDRSTAILMGEFYKELANAKVTKAEALRRAQVILLKQYPNYSRPGYWAAYVLVGNWL
jgi:CHAT domain-containing protein